MNEFSKAFIAMGITLVVAGVGLLGYLGYTVAMIIDTLKSSYSKHPTH